MSPQRIQAAVEQAWEQLLDLSLSAYALRSTPEHLAGYQALLSHMTSIASITSWKAGKWLPVWSALLNADGHVHLE